MIHRLQAILFSLLLVACGGGGDAAPDTAQAPVADIVVRDAGSTELSSFQGTIRSVHLTRADGSETANLLAGEIALEFVGLSDLQAWLAKVELEAGTYTGLRVAFAPDGYGAAGPAGDDLFVVTDGSDLEVEFDTPLVFGDDDCRIELELDLDEGLNFLVGNDWVDFVPLGRATVDGPDELPVDEFNGVVVAASVTERFISVDAFADDDMTVPLGEVRVQISDDTELVDDDERPLAEIDFYQSLVLGRTVVEVHGALDMEGVLVASRVEIEGDKDDPMLDDRVQIEGRIVKFQPDAREFVLLIRRIEKGADVAEPVLEELGGPLIIAVAYDDETTFHLPGDADEAEALFVGQLVEVEFREFTTEPFPAAEVESAGAEGCFEFSGVVEDTDFPDSIVVRIDDYDPLVWFGDDDDDDHGDDDDDHGDDDDGDWGGDLHDDHGDDDDDDFGEGNEVRVLLADAEILLDLGDRPELVAENLHEGLRVKIRGCFREAVATDDHRVVEADRIRVHPGKLIKADVSGVEPEAHRFSTSSSFIVQSFGGEFVKQSGGPLTLLVDDRAHFKGDADSEPEFYEAFEGLDDSDGEPDEGPPEAERLEVQVRGITDAEDPTAIRAFEVKSKLQKN